MKDKKGKGCCKGKSCFPGFAIIVLLIGISWLLTDLGILTVKIPWWPIILIVVATGWIVDSFKKK